MPRGGWRGGGRPRIHLDESGEDHRVRAHVLLTEDADDLLLQLCNLHGRRRSETIRILITEAATARGFKVRPVR